MAVEVFLSYARREHRAEARALRDALSAAGIPVFLDEQDIADGAAFPAAIGAALMAARVAVVFAGEAYFQRPWCVHEFRLLCSGWRPDPSGPAPAPDLSDAMVVALPKAGDVEAVVAQLPPALASLSWPAADRADALAALVQSRLTTAAAGTIGDRLAALADDTLARLRAGADQPLAWAEATPPRGEAAAPVSLTDEMPVPRGDGFHGRALLLWRLVHELVSARAFTPARRVVLQGLGGSGKSLCAAEFVARHARRAFPGGVVWVDASSGVEGLFATGQRLWAALGPEPLPLLPADASPQSRWQALAAPLAARLQARTTAGRLLWVIDNLPEPGSGEGGIAAWCPAPRQVSVLVTTRRSDTLRDSDATLAVGPLGAAAGLALLTSPPVQLGWLPPERWAAVVRWVGALPLALTVLRAALLDGGLAVAELGALPAGEPAAETERLMQALRGEVDDSALRGAAEAFDLALQALQRESGLATAALTLALLAPVALDEALLAAAVGSPAVGRLVRRGWLQAAGDATTRRFSLHRVPASVLRLRLGGEADTADAAFAAAFDALASVAAMPDTRAALHLDAVMQRLVPRGSAGAPVFDALRRMLPAVFVTPAPRGLGFLAAQAAGVMGLGAELVDLLRERHDLADDVAAEALPHTLQALPHEPAAMAWMAGLLRDPRPRVRWQAMAHAPAVPALVQPALTALLDGTADRDTGFYDAFLRDAALVRPVMSDLLDAESRADAARRRIVHTLFGKLLAWQGRDFVAGGFRGAALRAHLLQRAQDALDIGDAESARVAVTALAAGDAPFDDETWPALGAAVDEADSEARNARLHLVRAYLAATRRGAPHDVRVDRDDEGGVRISGEFFPRPTPWPPEVVPRLIGWVVDGAADTVGAAAAVLASDDQGLHDASAWAHAQIDAGQPAPVRRLADAVLALDDVGPRAVNVRWWRARAALADGGAEAAVPDLEAVLMAHPDFDDARRALVNACLGAGEAALAAQDGAAVLAWGRRAEAAMPDAVGAQQLQAIGHHLMGDHVAAEAAAGRVVAARPGDGEGWWLRALVRLARGRRDEARADAEEAVRLAPAEGRYRALRDQIDAGP